MNGWCSHPAPPCSSISVTQLGSCFSMSHSFQDQTKTAFLAFPAQPRGTVFGKQACEEVGSIVSASSAPVLVPECSCLLFFHSGDSPGRCLPPEPLPAPLHWQLLQQPQESSVTTGTHCGHAHLQSTPSPWLQACGLSFLLSRRFPDGSTWYNLSPFTREALAHFILHNVVFPRDILVLKISRLGEYVLNSVDDFQSLNRLALRC